MHKALYREYRPQKFSDVVGQEHIVRTLKNEIISGNIAHAYMFSGTRGTGKTTAAKIFARAVNCLNPKDGEPCNECESCRAIINDSTVDIFEIDAASNNSVDDVREIRESVKYTPTNSKYKVYIIDEAHMLSKGASNALLKTIEEPPEYVVFIFATTEPNKMIPTVLSRCQRFDFKRITIEEMKDRMRYICSKEGVEVEEDALSVIARNSQGALRDALSILDRCILFGENYLKYDDVVEILGIVNIDEIFGLADDIINHKVSEALQKIDSFISSGKDIEILSSELIEHMRSLMICLAAKENAKNIISVSDDEFEKMKNSIKNTDIDNIIRIINILSEVQNNLKYAIDKRTIFEVGIIKTIKPIYDTSKQALEERVKYLEQIIESGNITINSKNIDEKDKKEDKRNDIDSKKVDVDKKSSDNKKKKYEEMKSEDLNKIERLWDKVLDTMKKDRKMPVRAMLLEKKNIKEHNGVLYIIFGEKFAFAKKSLTEHGNLEYIENVIKSVVHKNFSVKIILESEADNINMEIEKESDKGEEILKRIVSSDIIEIKEGSDKEI
ncbi:DNA polymerase III subunit gamma/tau [Peptacetobacter sp.]|uniref:DNA polymerase III subunit gamma/tau n=1 Tax=Peptacetobacter sp. TaxID=2991975 RepID=UPI002624C2AD|nr:DNA polymerase III subunit gamma/tau [Peptacetobacter sp.]